MSRTRPVIVCLAGDQWDGNPHSRHHLMRRLTADFEVLFVEDVPMRGLAARDPQDLRRALRKLRTPVRLRTVQPGLHVLKPVPVPPAGRLAAAGQSLAVRLAILAALRALRLGGPRLLWASLPNAATLLGRLGEVGSLFYYQDRYGEFTHVNREVIGAQVRGLASGCEVSVASSQPLADDLRALGTDPIVIRHGVDSERFRPDGAPPPEDIARLEPPWVGCVGLIDDYLDLAAVRMVADRLSRGTVVMVGASNSSHAALRHPRIAVLGRRPYSVIPRYVSAFDCCLVPFARSRLTEAVNPIKLREYLAAGRPVVATDLPETRRYADVVRLAADSAEFADQVEEALAEDGRELSALRSARVATETWDSAAEQVAGLLASLLAQAGPRGGCP